MSTVDSDNIYTQLGINKPKTTETKSNSDLGQSDFLELMTAQLRFQDPLSPAENSDFLAQMAQFGTVSGINDLNSAFGTMSAAFQGNQALQASTMVGRTVLVTGDLVQVEAEGDVHAGLQIDQPVSKAIIYVTDDKGQLVHRIDLGQQQAGLLEFHWDALNSNGDRLDPGTYQFTAELRQGEKVSAGEVLTAVQVESVTLGRAGSDLTLTVSNLGDIGMSQVRKIM